MMNRIDYCYSQLKTILLLFTVFTVISACGGGDNNGSDDPTITDTKPPGSLNNNPIANAGEHQHVSGLKLVRLDGSNSSDADNDALSYRWTIQQKPQASSLILVNNLDKSISVTPDKYGDYIFNLIVNDGIADSIASFVTVSVDYLIKANGPVGNFVSDVAIDTLGNVYAVRNDAIYHSTTVSDSWTRIDTNGLHHETINNIGINSQNNLFIATAKGRFFTSTDLGVTWNVLSVVGGVRKIIVNENDDIFIITNTNMSRSTDNGMTWTGLGAQTQSFIDLVFNSSGHVFAATASQLFTSTDNGNAWSDLVIDNALGSIRDIEFDSLGSLYMTTSTGIYFSNDEGVNWQLLESDTGRSLRGGVLSAGSSGIMYYAGLYGYTFSAGGNTVSSFSLNPTGATGVFIGANVDWMKVSGDGVIYIVSSYGLLKGPINNIGLSRVISGLRVPHSIGKLTIESGGGILTFGGTGLWRSSYGSEQWLEIWDSYISTVGENNGTIFMSAHIGGVLKSQDNGSTWVSANVGIDGKLVGNAFVFNSQGHVFASASNGLYRSLDNGDSWVKLLDGTFRELIINSQDQIFIWNSGVITSTDNGDTWSNIATPFPGIGKTLSSLALNELDVIFAGAGSGAIFTSDDNGISWSETSQYFSYIINIKTYKQYVFAATWWDVFYSVDDGLNWQSLSAGLNDVIVNTIDIDRDGYLLVSTRNGLYRSVGTIDLTLF